MSCHFGSCTNMVIMTAFIVTFYSIAIYGIYRCFVTSNHHQKCLCQINCQLRTQSTNNPQTSMTLTKVGVCRLFYKGKLSPTCMGMGTYQKCFNLFRFWQTKSRPRSSFCQSNVDLGHTQLLASKISLLVVCWHLLSHIPL